MQVSIIVLMVLALMAVGYQVGRKRSVTVAGGQAASKHLHSLPSYYGFYTALWAGLPALVVVLLWTAFQDGIVVQMIVADLPPTMQQLSEPELNLVINDIQNLAAGGITSGAVNPDLQTAADHYRSLQQTGTAAMAVVVLCTVLAFGWYAWRAIVPKMRARNRVESIVMSLLVICSSIAIFTTIGIVLSVLFESIRFFQVIPFTDFLFGLEWSPQTAIRADQVGSTGAFGAIPLFAGTLLISVIALLISVPIGLMAAIYLSEYAGSRMRSIAKPVLEVLAGVPTVVYGFFAALTVAPFIRDLGDAADPHLLNLFGVTLTVSSESALAAGVVMGIMIIPFVSSLSDDVINAVPQSMRDASFGLGATQSETIRQVIIPAALPGIVGGVLLAASRAIGETMIVVMAAGLSANLTANPLESVTTVTVQIVTLLVGDQEFDSPKTLAAFALGLVLFVVTLALNVFALHVVRKYREQYE